MTKTFTAQDVAERYDAARTLPQESIDLWISALKAHLPDRSPVGAVLDLGCGTGRFSEALARGFGCPVFALDPSRAMVDLARGKEGVYPFCASAERLPLRPTSVDLVWMSQVFHHLDRPRAALAEIRRTLIDGGALGVRNASRETDREALWLDFFPEAIAMNVNNIPPRSTILDLITAAGFALTATEKVYQLFARSHEEYCNKIGRRGLSPLIAISDGAFEAGMDRLRRWTATQPPSIPIWEPLDLFVFRSIGGGR